MRNRGPGGRAEASENSSKPEQGDVTMAATSRNNEVTMKGNPVTLLGPRLNAGDKAPAWTLQKNDLSDAKAADYAGKTVILSVVPSLDTPVCDLQTKRFNEEAGKLKDVAVLTVSMDLPFAQKRWCGAANATNVITLSDHRDGGFGRAYGVLIDGLRLLSRAVFVVGPDGKVKYVEYVKEITEHPNYEAALRAAK
jgi:thioredoxin-dependent peroxiredoxin